MQGKELVFSRTRWGVQKATSDLQSHHREEASLLAVAPLPEKGSGCQPRASPLPVQSNKDILILPAQLGQSLTRGKKHQENQTRQKINHSTVHWEIIHEFTHSQTGGSHALPLEKPLGLACFLHLCSLNNKIITHSVFES